MAKRTSKGGIVSKKRKQAKQAQALKSSHVATRPKLKLSLVQAKESGVVISYKNPQGNTYHWFAKGRKLCRETRLRVDPDYYRYVKTSTGSSTMVKIQLSGWVSKRLRRYSSGGK